MSETPVQYNIYCYEVSDKPKHHRYPFGKGMDDTDKALVDALFECCTNAVSNSQSELKWVPKTDTTFGIRAKVPVAKNKTKSVWIGNVRINGIMETLIAASNKQIPIFILQCYLDALRDGIERHIMDYETDAEQQPQSSMLTEEDDYE